MTDAKNSRESGFKASELKRLVRSVQTLDLPVVAVEVKVDDSIVVHTATPTGGEIPIDALTAWEKKRGLRL